MTTQALAKKEDSLEALLAKPGYQARFKEVLLEKAPQFCSSLVSIGRSMPDVEPKSIVGAGMIAACLDLPIDRNLGFAWIVPYKKIVGGVPRKFAQFQMGYKGYIQLAQRTGYYAGMNACAINAEAYGGRDSIGEPIILWDKIDEAKAAIGYAFAFKMVNGFQKVCFWSKEKVFEHARRYSQAFRAGGDTPWKSHPDKMAIKTVIANELSDWGILSIQFQLAKKSDQGVKVDIDAEVEYIDGTGPGLIGNGEDEEKKPEPTTHQKATQAPVKPPQDKPKEEKPAETPKPVETPPQPQPASAEKASGDVPKAETTSQAPETPAEDDNVVLENVPATPPAAGTSEFVPDPNETPELQEVRRILHTSGKTEAQLIDVLRKNHAMKPEQTKLGELSSKKHQNIKIAWPELIKQMP